MRIADMWESRWSGSNNTQFNTKMPGHFVVAITNGNRHQEWHVVNAFASIGQIASLDIIRQLQQSKGMTAANLSIETFKPGRSY